MVEKVFASCLLTAAVSPGQHMARASIWIVVASLLATFDITNAVDDNGDVVEPSGEYSQGNISSVTIPF